MPKKKKYQLRKDLVVIENAIPDLHTMISDMLQVLGDGRAEADIRTDEALTQINLLIEEIAQRLSSLKE